jgi:hypothetical protein
LIRSLLEMWGAPVDLLPGELIEVLQGLESYEPLGV